MTTITINLPEKSADSLRAEANAVHMSLEDYISEAVSHFALADEGHLEPIALTPEETDALVRAREDFAAGRTYSHEEVMAAVRARRS
jgi:predicted transcriptional regulator